MALVQDRQTSTPRYFLSGLLITLCALGFLELRFPFFFVEDDNVTQFFPVILDACRVAFAGELPTWNPHQLLGAPTFDVGMYALAYPPIYLSYALARFMLGAETWTLDVFCIAHLLAAYALGFWAAGVMGVRAPTRLLVGLAMALSGFVLVGGRSWFHVIPVAAFVPWQIGALHRLRTAERPGRWSLLLGLSLGLQLYSGNSQLWVYTWLLHVVVVVVMLLDSTSRRWALWLLGTWCFALALAAPMLYTQLSFAESVVRQVIEGWVIEPSDLWAFVVPAWDPPRHPQTIEQDLSIYYFGALALTALVASVRIRSVRALADNPWLVAMWLSFWLGLGSAALGWALLWRVPGFHLFQVPLKFLLFVQLFGAFAGASTMDRFLARLSPPWGRVVLSASIVLMLVHIAGTTAAFFQFHSPPVPKEMELVARLSQGSPQRFLSMGQRKTPGPSGQATLPHNLATHLGLWAFAGHDPLVASSRSQLAMVQRLERDPVSTLRAYGVRWLLVEPRADETHALYVPGPASSWTTIIEPAAEFRRRVLAAAVLRHRAEGVLVYELDGAQPLAFVDTKVPLPLSRRANHVLVEVSRLAALSRVTVSFLWRPGMTAALDGASLALDKDAQGRLVVVLPHAGQELAISYRPDLDFSSALALGIVALLAWHLARRHLAPRLGAPRLGRKESCCEV